MFIECFPDLIGINQQNYLKPFLVSTGLHHQLKADQPD